MKAVNSQYLATTGISELWNLDSELLILGPWCLVQDRNKQLISGKDHVLIQSPFDNAQKVKEAGNYCTREYNLLLSQLAEKLNAIHGVSYSLDQWRILVGPWLWHFIGVFYDRFARVELVIQECPGLVTSVSHSDFGAVTPAISFDFNRNALGDEYNHQIFSIIFEYLRFGGVRVVKRPFSVGSHTCIHPQNVQSRIIGSLMGSIARKQNVVLSEMYHLSNADRLSVVWATRGRALFVDSFGSDQLGADVPVSASDRMRIHFNSCAPGSFRSLLYSVIPRFIPKCYVENFRAYNEQAQGNTHLRATQAVGSAIGWYYNEPFKFFAAHVIGQAGELVDFQHGGGYGFADYIPEEQFSLERDIFYSWGWCHPENPSVRPLPSAHLSKLKVVRKSVADGVLFVSTSTPPYHYKFQSILRVETVEQYFADQVSFYREFLARRSEKMFYRPFCKDYGWGERQMIAQACPSVNFLDSGKLVDWMSKMKLVIIDHAATSFLEALVMNVPSVFYWRQDNYAIREDARQYFDLLVSAGILHYDPVSAAHKASDVVADSFAWWNSELVQSARKIFCSRYAYAASAWCLAWADAFSRIEGV